MGKEASVLLSSDPADREFYNELSSLWLVVLDPDETVMIGNNAVDNRQPEAGPRFLGGKIGLEEPGAVFRGNSVSAVGNYA